MAYKNKISILITAEDIATPVLAEVAARAEEQQTALAAAAEESAAKQAEASDQAAASVDAAQTSMAESLGRTEAAFVSLGASSEEYQANMVAIAAATGEAEGGITVLGDDAVATRDVVISSNDEMIASYRELAAAADTSGAGSAAGADAAAAGGISKGVGMAAMAVAAATAVAAGLMVKSAATFQQSLTRLATSAGESYGNLKMVGNGILQIARDTGTATGPLTSAMYQIESGGYHGAAGLEVLTAAAQGAKTENADLGTVAHTVAAAMNDYRFSAAQAATVTSKLVVATGQGMTTFQQLAAALPQVLSKASAAGIGFNEILGALASMTQHGMSADQAAQNLAHTISSLQSPTMAMSKELASLGLNSTVLSQNLGKTGLVGSIQEISQAIQADMGKGSTAVILNMTDALKGLPPAVQAMGQELMNGSVSYETFYKAAKQLNPLERSQVQAFMTLYDGMHTIGTEQMSGAQVMQTYAGAMHKALGTSDALNVALMLTGKNTAATNAAIAAVSKATAQAGNNVQGWTDIQHNFNQQLSVLREDVGTTAIAIGEALLPPLTAIAKALTGTLGPIANFISHNKKLAAGIILTIGGISTFVALSWALQKSTKATKEAFDPLINVVKKFTAEMWGLDAAEGSQGLGKVTTELQGVKIAASDATSEVNTLATRTSLLGKLGVGGGLLSGGGATVAGDAATVAAGGAEAASATGATGIGATIAGGLVGVLTGPLGIAIGATIGTAFAVKAAKAYVNEQNQKNNQAVGLPSKSTEAQQATRNHTSAINYHNQALAQHKKLTSELGLANKNLIDDHKALATSEARRANDIKTLNKLQAEGKTGDLAYNKTLNDLYNTYGTISTQQSAVSRDQGNLNTLNSQAASVNRQLGISNKDVSSTTANVTNLTVALNATRKNESGQLQIVRGDQAKYNEMVKIFGPNSLPAINALKQLHTDQGKLNSTQTTARQLQGDINNLNHDAISPLVTRKQKTDDMKRAQDDLNNALRQQPSDSILQQILRDAPILGRITSDIHQWAHDFTSFFAGNSKETAAATTYFSGKQLAIPHRAGGGSVQGGSAYIVGEQGSELFVPDSSGTIIPHGQTTGMPGSGAPTVVIQNLIINNNTDANMVTKKLGWALANA